MRHLTPILAPLMFAATLAAAQETSGTVTGTLDLEERVWNVADADADADASSGWTESEGAFQATIATAPDPKGGGDQQVLTLRFTVREAGTSPVAQDLHVTLTSGQGADFTATPANTDITLNAMSVEGSDLIVAGSLVAVLSEGERDEIVPADEEGAVTLDANFQATLQRLE